MEKEKLFYDLHQTIKSIGMTGEGFEDIDKNNWIKDLSAKISQMNDEILEIVLEIYKELTSYTKDNISFIISNTDSLRNIFYKDGILVKENLALLYEPYCRYLNISPIITLHCFNNNITEIVELLSTCIYSRATIESLILGKKISNLKIINTLDDLFELNKISQKFVESFADNAGPLHKMQMEIFQKTRPEDANDQRLKYINFLLSNKDNNLIDTVIEYINSNEFIEYKTVQDIQSLNIKCLSELISKYGEKVVYEEILTMPNLKALFQRSPKIAMRLYDLHIEGKLDGDLDSIANTFYPLTNHFKLIEMIL